MDNKRSKSINYRKLIELSTEANSCLDKQTEMYYLIGRFGNEIDCNFLYSRIAELEKTEIAIQEKIEKLLK